MRVGSSSGGSSVGPLSVHGVAESFVSERRLSHLDTRIISGIHFIVAVVDVCVSEDSEFWLRGLVALSATRQALLYALLSWATLALLKVMDGPATRYSPSVVGALRGAAPKRLRASVRLAFSNLGLVVGVYTISICSFTISSLHVHTHTRRPLVLY
ncbi:hypothetical protein DFH11DRAFT_1645013 [Phellopilus nigrolimitatus]|nr:hypothetical protein DFH11DRAFT_1645013 [Phellopilus nigrolimitatus]